MIRRTTFLLSVLAISPAPVLAQTPQDPSPKALALAQRYLADAEAERILDNEGPTIARYLLSRMPAPAGGEAKANEVRDAMIEAATAAVKDKVPEFLQRSARIYASVFTETELTAIVAFYDSPAGRAFVAKTSDASAPMAALIHDIGGEIQTDVNKRFCAREPEECKAATPQGAPAGKP